MIYAPMTGVFSSINLYSLAPYFVFMARKSTHDSALWFSAARAAALTGLSSAMVNYLCREGMVEPSCSCPRGHGSKRHYSFGDLVALRLVARLSATGVSPLRLKQALRSLRKYHPEITLQSLPASHIVTNGKYLFLRQKDDSIERLLDGQLAFAFVVELPLLRDEVAREITLEAERRDRLLQTKLRQHRTA